MNLKNLKKKKMLYMMALSLMAGGAVNTMSSTPDVAMQIEMPVEESVEESKLVEDALIEKKPEAMGIDYSKPVTQDVLDALIETKDSRPITSLYHYKNVETGEKEAYLVPRTGKKLQFVRRSLILDHNTTL